MVSAQARPVFATGSAADDIDDSSPASSPGIKKRSADEAFGKQVKLNIRGNQFLLPSPPYTDRATDESPPAEMERSSSPAPSESVLSTVSSVQLPEPAGHENGAVSVKSTQAPTLHAGQPPAKRRKLSPAEKEQQKREKEAKAAEKAEQKALKEAERTQKEAERARQEEEKAQDKARRDAEKAEEKARKDDEKRAKDEDKRRKAEEREARKREKDLEEERRAQEKAKKERAQMKLGAFFMKPTTPSKTVSDSPRQRSVSVEPTDAKEDATLGCGSRRNSLSAQVPDPSAYHKFFLPFELPSYSSLAPTRDAGDIETIQEVFDRSVTGAMDVDVPQQALRQLFAEGRPNVRGRPLPRMREIVEQIHGSISQPIDLTKSGVPAHAPREALQNISLRLLHFNEDVRPAYFGSYTKIRSPEATTRLRRNPFKRLRSDTDYDYDSEAEWEEPEEGEDLLDEDDDEAESTGEAEEMQDFLDDEDDATKLKRRMITGDLMPSCSGLCWEASNGKQIRDVDGDPSAQSMHGMRMGVLIPGFKKGPIDPFSTAYWEPDPVSTAPPAATATTNVPTATLPGFLVPPRNPLQPRTNNSTAAIDLVGATEGEKGPIRAVTAATPKPKPSPKLAKALSNQDLDEFKDAVVGSQLPKAELLKGLKSRFPKWTNDVIKVTLSEHFAQIGLTKADKKWVFVVAS